MAEEKKEDKKDFTSEIVAILVGLFFLSLIVERVYTYWTYYSYGGVWWISVARFFAYTLWPLWKGVAIVVILLSVVVIWRVYSMLSKLNEEEREIYGSRAHIKLDGEVLEPKNEKWEGIIEKINSSNSADWRVAILEADIMLEDLLRRSGYHGDSLGEMLKSVEKSDMLTLESAWEAHKVRNAIAHKPDYDLNEREAKRAISLFEDVFKEFKII